MPNWYKDDNDGFDEVTKFDSVEEDVTEEVVEEAPAEEPAPSTGLVKLVANPRLRGVPYGNNVVSGGTVIEVDAAEADALLELSTSGGTPVWSRV